MQRNAHCISSQEKKKQRLLDDFNVYTRSYCRSENWAYFPTVGVMKANVQRYVSEVIILSQEKPEAEKNVLYCTAIIVP